MRWTFFFGRLLSILFFLVYTFLVRESFALEQAHPQFTLSVASTLGT